MAVIHLMNAEEDKSYSTIKSRFAFFVQMPAAMSSILRRSSGTMEQLYMLSRIHVSRLLNFISRCIVMPFMMSL